MCVCWDYKFSQKFTIYSFIDLFTFYFNQYTIHLMFLCDLGRM